MAGAVASCFMTALAFLPERPSIVPGLMPLLFIGSIVMLGGAVVTLVGEGRTPDKLLGRTPWPSRVLGWCVVAGLVAVVVLSMLGGGEGSVEQRGDHYYLLYKDGRVEQISHTDYLRKLHWDERAFTAFPGIFYVSVALLGQGYRRWRQAPADAPLPYADYSGPWGPPPPFTPRR